MIGCNQEWRNPSRSATVRPVRSRLLRFGCLLALAATAGAEPAGRAAAPSSKTTEILAALRTCMEGGQDPVEPIKAIEDLPYAELKQLVAKIDAAWPKVRDTYLASLGTMTPAGGGATKTERAKVLRDLRAEFASVYQLNDDAMKPLLASKSEPAVNQLHKLLLPSAADLLASADPALLKRRESARVLAKFRDAVLEKAVSATPSDSLKGLEAAEQAAAAKQGGLDRDGLKILERNRKTATEARVPEDEVRGIEECNIMRLLVGLNACLLDPRLCEAARGHSKDMVEKNFFAHDSPVPGKATPWDRAKLAGTSASAENIYAGSANPHDAIMGWFHSPGHHKNMFAPGVTTIGLGHHGGCWTQMFGP